MLFTPQSYKIPDTPEKPFIDPEEIWECLNTARSNPQRVREILAKSFEKQRLSMQETAILLNTTDPSLVQEIFDAAALLKKNIYGNRIVLFAPLYVGNLCINDCAYCGFKISNRNQQRRTLSVQELEENVKSLEQDGHKRLILVFGEHPHYSPHFIAETVRKVYSVKYGNGSIRRVNINAAPLDEEGFRIVKEAGIGTYQIFQETYHPDTYRIYHRAGKKMDFADRLVSLDRAQKAGLDDVGIGALFGLYDWRYEVLGLIRHTNHLEACFGVGPHTISFPRLQDAEGFTANTPYKVNDNDFLRLIAILRLAVPYTGLILTAREPAWLRDEAIRYGVSQIDAGTKLELGAYAEEKKQNQELNKEQFMINDCRSLNEVIEELISKNDIPSFCTACYRLGRTGEHFMEFSVPGFIKKYCQPNAILTLAEYLEDYAPEETRTKGYLLIEKEMQSIAPPLQQKIRERLEQIKQGKRDLYF